MTVLLAVLVALLATALVAQAAVNAVAIQRTATAHTVERDHLVAALIARTPGEYAGLLNVGGRQRPARPPKREDDDERPIHPEGL